MFMKKKKKKDNYSIAEQNIKILKSGKIKVKKGQKISLTPYVTNSVSNTVCSRIDGIIDKSSINSENVSKLTTTCNLSSMKRTVEMINKGTNSITKYTLVHVINKKSAIEIFDFLDDSIVGSLLRSSTLASIYKKIEDSWVELNDKDKTGFTNVLFIPDIFVFLDEKTGKIKKQPYTVNLLIISEPSLKFMSTGVETVTENMAVKHIISDVFTSAIKCNATNLIIAPYCHKLFLEDVHLTASEWHNITTIESSIKNINTVDFAINDDDLYIIFTKSNNKSDSLSE